MLLIGLLDLYEKEKRKNKMLNELYDDACICIAKDCIEKDKIKEKIEELIQEEKDTDGIVMNTKVKKILQELIGKEE